MKIGILGTGMVGNTIGTKLVQVGHEVTLGSRTANNENAKKWAAPLGSNARCGTFAQAAASGELLFNCTGGTHSLEALKAAGTEALGSKILIDVANPLETAPDGTIRLGICNTDSLGERIQQAFPRVRVVKALNTMNCEIMVAPSRVPGSHNVFLCGNDAAAKAEVANGLVTWFGWNPDRIIDLGDITAARGTEMFLPLWLRLWKAVGHVHFNIQVVRGR